MCKTWLCWQIQTNFHPEEHIAFPTLRLSKTITFDHPNCSRFSNHSIIYYDNVRHHGYMFLSPFAATAQRPKRKKMSLIALSPFNAERERDQICCALGELDLVCFSVRTVIRTESHPISVFNFSFYIFQVLWSFS